MVPRALTSAPAMLNVIPSVPRRTVAAVYLTGDLGSLLAEREYFRDPQVFRCRRFDAKWTEKYGHSLRTRKGDIYRGTILEHMLVQTLTVADNVALGLPSSRGPLTDPDRVSARIRQLSEAYHLRVDPEAVPRVSGWSGS